MFYYIKKDNKIVLADENRQTLENGQICLPQYQDLLIEITEKNIIQYNGEYVFEEDVQDKMAQDRRNKFNQEFFNTSLGYVRRTVTMKDGSHKDFLSDLFNSIVTAVNNGQEVQILTYDKPDFSQDVIDWVQYQHKVTVTNQFIQECFQQLSNDFFV